MSNWIKPLAVCAVVCMGLMSTGCQHLIGFVFDSDDYPYTTPNPPAIAVQQTRGGDPITSMQVTNAAGKTILNFPETHSRLAANPPIEERIHPMAALITTRDQPEPRSFKIDESTVSKPTDRLIIHYNYIDNTLNVENVNPYNFLLAGHTAYSYLNAPRVGMGVRFDGSEFGDLFLSDRHAHGVEVELTGIWRQQPHFTGLKPGVDRFPFDPDGPCFAPLGKDIFFGGRFGHVSSHASGFEPAGGDNVIYNYFQPSPGNQLDFFAGSGGTDGSIRFEHDLFRLHGGVGYHFDLPQTQVRDTLSVSFGAALEYGRYKWSSSLDSNGNLMDTKQRINDFRIGPEVRIKYERPLTDFFRWYTEVHGGLYYHHASLKSTQNFYLPTNPVTNDQQFSTFTSSTRSGFSFGAGVETGVMWDLAPNWQVGVMGGVRMNTGAPTINNPTDTFGTEPGIGSRTEFGAFVGLSGVIDW